MKNVNENKIKKPKFFNTRTIKVGEWIIGMIISSLVSLLCANALSMAAVIIIIIIALTFLYIIISITYLINTNHFYNDYEKQYNYFIDKLYNKTTNQNINDKIKKKLKNQDKKINELNDKFIFDTTVIDVEEER